MNRRGIATLVGSAFACGALLAASSGHTYASFSDFALVKADAKAGTWGPPPAPAECGRAADRFANVLVVPAGQTTFAGTVHDDLIFANDLGDTINGDNGDDCIVGGAGDDVLSGDNGKDVMIGGSGNDTINGDNGPDQVDGGDGDDTCNGGAAPDQVISCEHTS
jgi:Ca2+-binding RTX toxin-like protein